MAAVTMVLPPNCPGSLSSRSNLTDFIIACIIIKLGCIGF
jgi:hypothetical protein